jgi:hypothetical protein
MSTYEKVPGTIVAETSVPSRDETKAWIAEKKATAVPVALLTLGNFFDLEHWAVYSLALLFSWVLDPCASESVDVECGRHVCEANHYSCTTIVKDSST